MLAPCSSEATRTRAKVLADEIGSWHLNVSIDGIVSALLSLFQTVTGKRPRYKVKILASFPSNFIVLHTQGVAKVILVLFCS